MKLNHGILIIVLKLGRVNKYTESLKHVRIKLLCIKLIRKRMDLLSMGKPLRLYILGSNSSYAFMETGDDRAVD